MSGDPVRLGGGLDYGVGIYTLNPNRAKARIWLPSNGRPIKIRAETITANITINLEARFARQYHPDSNERAMRATGTSLVEMTLYPGTSALYLDVSRTPNAGYVVVTLAYL